MLSCKDASGNCNSKAFIIVECPRGTKLKLILARSRVSRWGGPYYDFVDESSCCFQYSTLSHFAWDSSCDDTWTMQAAQGATSDKERRF
jgi:hypothetical protein